MIDHEIERKKICIFIKFFIFIKKIEKFTRNRERERERMMDFFHLISQS